MMQQTELYFSKLVGYVGQTSIVVKRFSETMEETSKRTDKALSLDFKAPSQVSRTLKGKDSLI